MTRTAGEVGAGLAAAREARPIRRGERIHVLGIAGAGASGAAILARAAGAVVSGCDPAASSPYTPPLERLGIRIAGRHAPGHVTAEPAPDRLAVTKALTAIDPDNAELAAARSMGITIEPWQQVVADAAVGRTLVGVAGTHGKSSTAGWLTHVLTAAGTDPSAFVGALLPADVTGGLPATARVGRGEAFVVEADEYAGNFDPYRPAVTVLTSAEWDHPDVFADRDAVLAAFESWLRADRPVPTTLVANAADPGVAELLRRLAPWPGRVVATSLQDDGPAGPGPIGGDRLVGRIVAADADGTTLEIDAPAFSTRPLLARLATAGRHNAANALGVAGAALVLGLMPDAVSNGLGTFAGVGRRLERKGESRGVLVYDDYGHHPTAIAATIAAVRQRAPGRRLVAVYEPLTYHRTRALLEPFARSLAGADVVAVADIWPGRDTPEDRDSVSAADLAEAIRAVATATRAEATGTPEATAIRLAELLVPGDVVLVMGGGRSYRIGELLLDLLGE